MAVELCPLFSLEKQFQAKNGANNTNGFLKVFLAGTDDPATTYSDYVGTLNPQKIVLDDNGRAVVICDKAKAYRLEVYDANGMLLWTEEPKFCTGNGGGGVSVTRVVSTDGSISVDESVVGSQRTYDIGIAPSDSDEFLEWVKCSDEDVANGDIFPTYVDGTMETMGGQGLHVGKDRFYHGTVTVKVVPTGTGINYETLTASLKFGDETVVSRDFDIDNSLQDSVVCEFSYDFKAPEDGYLYLNLGNVGVFSRVDVEMQVHRIYSGINAVPDTCATKQWVQETFDYNLSGKIGYSALEYNSTGEITGISGSAIATTDPSIVSAIASSYAESAVSSISSWSGYFSSISSKADQSALEQCCDEVHSALDEKLDASASSQFQPSGDYAFNSSLSAYVEKSSYSAFSSEVTNNISSISSTVSGLTGQYIEQSASGMFQPSGHYVSASDMSAYVPFSGLEGDGSKITGISGSAIKGHEYTGIEPVWVDNTADQIGVHHKTLAVDETMTAYESGDSAVIGVNTASVLNGFATETYVDSGLSGKLDVTASSLFITSLPADLATTADVASAVSGKLDSSASGEFYPMTGNPSGFLTAHQSLAGYATEQYVDSSVSGKLDSTAYDSAQFILTSQSGLFQPSGHYQPSGEYLSATESANYYPTSNPSGFISGVDLSPYQKTADMTAYQPSGDYQTAGDYLSATDSAEFLLTSQSGMFAPSGNYQPSGDYLSATESANYYPTSNPSGFISGVDLSPYQKTADMSAYQPSGDYQTAGNYLSSTDSAEFVLTSQSGVFQPSGEYLSATESSNYYSTSNPSGFITGVDLTPYQTTADMSGYYTTANESGFITGVDLTPYQTTAGMTAYQEVSGMTAYQPVGDYQPSGDYIQESALGWVEV